MPSHSDFDPHFVIDQENLYMFFSLPDTSSLTHKLVSDHCIQHSSFTVYGGVSLLDSYLVTQATVLPALQETSHTSCYVSCLYCVNYHSTLQNNVLYSTAL